MDRRHLLMGLLSIPAAQAQVRGQLITQQINTICLAGSDYSSSFLQSLGASRVSAIVFSEVKGRAFLDVTNNPFNEKDFVYGIEEKPLLLNRSLLIAIPADYLVFSYVRLRVLNEDQTFGRIRGTLSVLLR
jgi:hypothetical protein